MSAATVLRRKRPCEECPWRKDTGQLPFTPERYEELRSTVEDGDGGHAKLGAPMFACHKSTEDSPCACAGYLAAVGSENVTVRVLVVTGAIPVEALSPGEDWPELFESYEEMTEAQT